MTQGAQIKKWMIFGTLILILAVAAIIIVTGERSPAPPVLTADDIREKLEQGEFKEAEQLIQGFKAQTPESGKLLERIESAIQLDLKFQFQKAGEQPAALASIRNVPDKKIALSHLDNYRIVCESDQGNGPLYIYLYQEDGYGKVDPLFPGSKFTKTENPVQPGKTIRIPTEENQWLYLDRLPPIETGTSVETIYCIASPWKAADVEKSYEAVYQSADKQKTAENLEKFIQRLKQRSETHLQSVVFQKFEFLHRLGG